ncbi:hypothetical protein LXL04_012562 [Taraxacum kok-saghyz]
MESEHEEVVTQAAPEEVVPQAAPEEVVPQAAPKEVVPQPVRVPNVGGLLANIRRKKSEIIIKQKLAKRVRGKNGEGSSVQKLQVIE